MEEFFLRLRTHVVKLREQIRYLKFITRVISMHLINYSWASLCTDKSLIKSIKTLTVEYETKAKFVHNVAFSLTSS